MTRKDIEDKIKSLGLKDPGLIKLEMEKWLKGQGCTDFDTQQILNDLDSYPDYMNLIN